MAIVGANADLHTAWRSDQAQKTVGETWRLAAQATAKIWTIEDEELIECVEFPLLEPFPIVDQFPDGRWLVANSRSRDLGNVRVLRLDGAEERCVELGDGIAHIKIDGRQRIWVGWFDEGVFGNDKWRYQGLLRPPSSYGMAAFDDRGELLTHATLEWIADCYALNVFGGEAWACTYTDFPILQITDGRERNWPTTLRGTKAIAVSYPYVLAAGGYQADANRLVLLRLEEHTAHPVGEWRLPYELHRSEVSMLDGRMTRCMLCGISSGIGGA